MSLSRKMAWKVAGLIVGLLMVSLISLWGLLGMLSGVRAAGDEYNELRLIRVADRHWATALGLIKAGAHPDQLADEVRITRDRVNDFIAFNEEQRRLNPKHETAEAADAHALKDDLDQILTELDQNAANLSPDHDLVGVVSIILDHLSTETDAGIAMAHQATSQRLTTTLVLLSVLSVIGAVATILLCIHQYRSVIDPLNRLKDGVQRIAQREFRDRIELSDDEEFVQLGAEFNRMADELESLYRNLESQVRQKGAELARSERLASVGFLAAGVAHEINNPLNVISAYAELALRRISKSFGKNDYDQETVKALEVIRDEALRCKDISQKLLSLARTVPEAKSPVSLKFCAEEVVTLVSALPGSKDRRVVLTLDEPAQLMVMGNEAELKQVLLNVVVNALESVRPGTGEVLIQGSRQNGWVKMCVSDNGVGMDAETLKHVFEPFFSRRPREHTQHVGIGLGLSITHAIVEAHEGTITAESEGPDHGSRFTIQLPFLGHG